MRERVVQLALPIIAATDESEDLSGMRVHRDKRHLRRRYGLALLPPDGVAPRQQLVDLLGADLNGLGSGALETGVEVV